MKVCVSGSFSTGKTTLVRSCANRLQCDFGRDVYVIKEVARRVIAAGFPLDRNATMDAYLHYVAFQLEGERMAAVHQDVLSDRSLLDSLAYVNADRHPSFTDPFMNMLTEIVWKETAYFDLYCYVPVEFSPVDDGIRSIDHEYQDRVDYEVIRLLNYFGVRNVKVTGPIEQRTETLTRLMLA